MLLLAVSAWRAHHDLVALRSKVPVLASQLEKQDLTHARVTAREVTGRAAAAQRWTHHPGWWLAAHIPGLRRYAEPTAEVTSAVDLAVNKVLAPSIRAADLLSSSSLRSGPGQINLVPLVDARHDLQRALLGSAQVPRQLKQRADYPDVLRRPSDDLIAKLSDVQARLTSLDVTLNVVTSLLGANRPQRIFVAFQNNAEVRATGGLVGALGIVETNKGRITLATVGSQNLVGGDFPKPVLDFGPDFDYRYGSFGTAQTFVNSNTSAHFPYAGQIWKRMWELRHPGQTIDAAVALDPVALSYVLRATGSVTVAGHVLDDKTLVPYVESQIYTEFTAKQTELRKQRLADVVKAVFQKLIDAPSSAEPALAEALRQSTRERRLLVWSDDKTVEAAVEPTLAGGAVPDKDTAPYAQLVLTNEAGSKLDYYISTTLTYSGEPCGAKTERNTKVVATIHNDAPTSGLPPYVTIRADANTVEGSRGAGAERLQVSLYATRDANFTGVRINGVQTGAFNETDRGHPVFSVELTVPPNGSMTVEWDLVEPSLKGAPVVLVPSTVTPSTATTTLPVCS